jgi:hypothetical protein
MLTKSPIVFTNTKLSFSKKCPLTAQMSSPPAPVSNPELLDAPFRKHVTVQRPKLEGQASWNLLIQYFPNHQQQIFHIPMSSYLRSRHMFNPGQCLWWTDAAIQLCRSSLIQISGSLALRVWIFSKHNGPLYHAKALQWDMHVLH